MMKKVMFALLAAACSSLMAEVLVYDYAASFKRLDVSTPVKVSYNKVTYKMDTAKVASDKFTGYVVVDACEECSGGMVYSGEAGESLPGNYAVVYIKRAGNKYRKNAVYRAIGRFFTGKFGAKSGIGHINSSSSEHVNPTKYTDALGFLSFWINANGVPSEGKPGFMGVDQSGYVDPEGQNWWEAPTAHDPLLALDYDTVDNAGYGKLVALKQILSSTCFADTTSVCWAVKNLSGSVLAGFNYTGTCNNPIYDLCYVDDDYLPGEIYMAPIAGTFTMKLNNSLSFYKKAFALSDFTAADAVVLKKLSVATPYGDETETTTFNADKGEALDTPLAW